MALVQQEIYRIPDRLRLRHVSVQSSDAGGVPPTAAVLMDVDGMEKSGAGFGVGTAVALLLVAFFLYMLLRKNRYETTA